MSPRPSVLSYPIPLQTPMFHAARFARALRVLHEDAGVDDAAFLWLEGRADEVIVFTSDILNAWSAGELTTSAAAGAIEGYLEALHATLEGWYGKWYAPSCCGPLPGVGGMRKRREAAKRRPDSRTDTLADVAVAELAAAAGDRGAPPVALASVHAMA